MKKSTSKLDINKYASTFFREKRIAMGMSQQDVAETIYGRRERQNVISDIENNIKQMNCHNIDRYCKHFNCDVVFKERVL